MLAFERANGAFIHGELQESKNEAKRRCEEFHKSSPQWAWKFRILEAKAALWQGLFHEVLTLFKSESEPSQPELAIPMLTVLGVAHLHIQQFSAAERALNEAMRLCREYTDPACGDLLQARGLLASEQGDTASAEKLFDLSLSFARVHHDAFLESTALLNLGAESLGQGRFDEALDRSEEAYRTAKTVDARVVELVTQGNIGWASYRLGDSEKALQLFLEAEKRAIELRDLVDQGVWLTNAGYIYMDAGNLSLAEQSFRRALTIEQNVNRKEHIYNALRALARLALQTGDVDAARLYADQALNVAKEGGNHLDELYPLLVQGQIAARRGNFAEAKQAFEAVGRDEICPVFLKWEAEHSLAQLYESNNQSDASDRKYRAALATFEAARADVRHEDFHLSFLTNGWHIYDDYIHFLAGQRKANDALRWADNSRARTLAEGLGLLPKGAPSAPGPLNATEIARRANGTLLFYWLGEKQSYLWVVTSRKTNLFPLAPVSEIDAVTQRYRKALAGPQDVLQSANSDGRYLYRMLIGPAQSLLGKNAKVFIIPDGSLNNLNFETLLVSEPALHFWIEDVTIANASSLRVLGASHTGKKRSNRSLLLVGDSVAPSPKYPELARAAAQMASVARHFPRALQRIITREFATPAAYLASSPEHFSYIHFVAHGTASRLSPLDSAIVLSKESAKSDSFKLYARDIVRHPLRADLVTISACYSAGERWYSGEGLVGLSWAFLRSGAHNVIAALWEAEDISTMELMDMFYAELEKGSSADAALRVAKLSLLHGRVFQNPFYWAPFQLYGGSLRLAHSPAHYELAPQRDRRQGSIAR